MACRRSSATRRDRVDGLPGEDVTFGPREPSSSRRFADIFQDAWRDALGDRFRARLSTPFVTAVVLHDQRCWLDQFTPDRVRDTALADFIRDRVRIQPDAQLLDGTAHIELELDGGSLLNEVVTVAKGEPENPITRPEIVEKFRAAAEPHLSESAAAATVEQCLDLELLDDVGTLARLLRRSSS